MRCLTSVIFDNIQGKLVRLTLDVVFVEDHFEDLLGPYQAGDPNTHAGVLGRSED